jgi:hypothetical protein
VPRVLTQAPEELTRGRLKRLGEGIGKVVYASEHWVVKRERPPAEVVALVVLWKILCRWAHMLPFGWGKRLLQKPSRVIRFLRVIAQTAITITPKRFWLTSHVHQVLRVYRSRDRRGEKLARMHLAGTPLVPERVTFPLATVLTGGWPGWLTVHEATERVEDTLDRRLARLAEAGDFAAVERWLYRFLETRQGGWQLGVFSVDAHLKNFGVIGDRVVLLDTGGVTNRWQDINARLSRDEQVQEPHVQLGLAELLAGEPELARRFNERWKSLVNHASVREHWPADPVR